MGDHHVTVERGYGAVDHQVVAIVDARLAHAPSGHAEQEGRLRERRQERVEVDAPERSVGGRAWRPSERSVVEQGEGWRLLRAGPGLPLDQGVARGHDGRRIHPRDAHAHGVAQYP